MKKLIKNIIAGILLSVTGFAAFAQSTTLKVDASKIIVVGKMTVVYDEDREFIFKTRGIPESQIDEPDTYNVPYISDPNDTWGSNLSKYYKENKTVYPNGEFFIVQYGIPKKGDKVLRFRSWSDFKYFDSSKASIWLPLPDFDVDIPDGVSALYIGSFTFYVTGDNFTIENIEHIDEFDLAQEELDRALGTHCDLVRAVLKDVE